MSFVFNPPTPTPAPPKPPPQPKPATKKRKTPPVMSEKEVKNLLYSEMGRGGSLSEATRKYLRCVETCYVRYGDGAPEKEPRIPNRRSISYNRKREKWVVWNNQNKKLKRCLTRCKNEWYRAVVNLIGDYNYNSLNEDVLSHILTMVVKPRAKKKSAKKKSAKKGGRKTRRKKGTRRKRKRRK